MDDKLNELRKKAAEQIVGRHQGFEAERAEGRRIAVLDLDIWVDAIERAQGQGKQWLCLYYHPRYDIPEHRSQWAREVPKLKKYSQFCQHSAHFHAGYAEAMTEQLGGPFEFKFKTNEKEEDPKRQFFVWVSWS